MVATFGAVGWMSVAAVFHSQQAVRMSRDGAPGEGGGDREEALDDTPSESEVPSQFQNAEDGDGVGYDPQMGHAFRRGDQEAFRAILERFGRLIQATLASFAPDDPDTRDVLYQEVCIRIWEQYAKYEERGKMQGWLVTLARRHARNCLKQESSYQSMVERYCAEYIPRSNMSDLLANPEKLLRYGRFLNRVRSAHRDLPDRQAKTLELVVREDRTTGETAKELGVSRATVRSNLRLARAKLRALLSDAADELS
ncbi:MAG: sigma-70 family RNA polymerase sigma factor [Gemmatimonadetes bacterium]|nr:sigma-70 family RNA polymerase sigma factor [Gemmatimonadota bacterium]MYG21772.1 sigma-70 family RNA polymerase sigma factor [Gemmatimonadota bacterium]MYJ40411.1 sigma-70 family RNA polymerase sigma factor [Gemmatimonadota bacterium]